MFIIFDIIVIAFVTIALVAGIKGNEDDFVEQSTTALITGEDDAGNKYELIGYADEQLFVLSYYIDQIPDTTWMVMEDLSNVELQSVAYIDGCYLFTFKYTYDDIGKSTVLVCDPASHPDEEDYEISLPAFKIDIIEAESSITFAVKPAVYTITTEIG